MKKTAASALAGLSLLLLSPGLTVRLAEAVCSRPTNIVLVRHGQTRWNALGLLQGNADVALDETGRAQVQALGQTMAGKAVAAVYSSPLSRALDTARAIAAPHGLPVSPRDGLREIGVGIYTGRASGQIPAETRERWASDPDFRMPSGVPDLAGLEEPAAVGGRLFEGESLNMVGERAWREVGSLAERYCGANVVAVTHGGVIQVVLTRARGVPVTEFRKFKVGNASKTVLVFQFGGAVAVGEDW